ncbi:MAG: ParB/RepB/Spo0J family partition protein [Lachnospiraceae bacterium]
MKNRSGEKIKLTSIDELLGVVNEESAMEIEIDKIKPFAGHPFKVIDDEKMQDLVESIKEFGVLTPVLIRPEQNEGYEMISGHRRMHAALQAGLITVPAIVREMTDDEAVIAMVDANIQREELLPSEKAFAYKMKLEAMKRQGCRNDLTSGQNDQKLSGSVSRDILAEQVGESSKQIQRYIRLTELIPDLLELVDKKRLNFTIAVDISYIPQDVQKWIYEYICDNGFIKPNQIAALRNYLGQGPVTQSLMISILNSHIPVKAPARKVTLNEKKLTRYFPKNYTSEDMEKVIESLLEKWKQEQEVM